MTEFYVWIEQDEDVLYVGEVPSLPACYAQGRTIDELLANIRGVSTLCLEGEEMIGCAVETAFAK